MNTHRLLAQLMPLNELEALAAQYYQKTGKNLEYYKFILLTSYAKQDLPPVSYLTSSAFEAESEVLRNQFADLYRNSGLDSKTFMQENRTIEVEKLLRFVHIPSHHHDFIEMSYVISGTCMHKVMGETYPQQQGCLTFINPQISHELAATSDCICMTIKVKRDVFSSWEIPNLPFFSTPICFQCGDDSFMRDILLSIYAQQENAGCYHDEIISLLLQAFLTYCMQNYRDTITFLYSGTPRQGRMKEILNYIYENYQSITLKGLSLHFGYSESYLCRLFKNEFSESFSSILRNFRLTQAQKLLLTTDYKLDFICDMIGYSDTTQFIRDFKKKYQITPAKYRKFISENQHNP